MRVDPDGRDWEIFVDHENRTITIIANFTTLAGDGFKNSLQGTANDWNDQSGKFNFVVGKGEGSVSYSIDFQICVNEPEKTEANNMATPVPDDAKLFAEGIRTYLHGNT